MPEENDALVSAMSVRETHDCAGRRFYFGQLGGRDVVIVASRWGKVAAAATAAHLLTRFNPSAVVFFGIAGALLDRLHPGDVVVSGHLFQHDLDASPFFPPTQVPQLGLSAMPSDPALGDALLHAASIFLRKHLPAAAAVAGFGDIDLGNAAAHRGDIASGDQVIFSSAQRSAVLDRVPSALCVEMEGAAVAQVAFEYGVPFACVRTISDRADEHGGRAVQPFLSGLAGVYTLGIAQAWLAGAGHSPT